jgi:hypothetical protein
MVDRISSLQDEILCHILSFVTTKEAVATSVLSKRWTHLWISVPNIDFTNIRVDSIISNYKFNESVYSVLSSRDAAGSNVDSFHLYIVYSDPHLAYDCGFPNIVRWINHVVQRKLKHLRLHLDEGKYDDDSDDDDDEVVPLAKLPISIFTCKTLVSLDLYRFCVEGFDFSSIGFGFPSLKTLNLEYIEFFEDRDFVLLLSGCPNLEDLKLVDVFFAIDKDPLVFQEFKSLSLPKLTRANISECFWYFFHLETLSTSQSMCLDTLKLHTKDHEVGEVRFILKMMHVTSIYLTPTHDYIQLFLLGVFP